MADLGNDYCFGDGDRVRCDQTPTEGLRIICGASGGKREQGSSGIFEQF